MSFLFYYSLVIVLEILWCLGGRMGFKILHRFFGLAFGMVSSLHVRCKVPIIHLIKLRIFFVIVIFTTWMYTFFELHLKWDLLLGFQL